MTFFTFFTSVVLYTDLYGYVACTVYSQTQDLSFCIYDLSGNPKSTFEWYFWLLPLRTVFLTWRQQTKKLPLIMVKRFKPILLGSAFDGERIESPNFYHNFLHHRRFGDLKYRVLQLYYVVQRSTNRGAQHSTSNTTSNSAWNTTSNITCNGTSNST